MDGKAIKIINKAIGPLLAGAATAIAAIATPPTGGLAPVALSIATGILGSKISDLSRGDLINRLKNIDPKDLNHDILKVTRSAAKIALKKTIAEYENEKDKLLGIYVWDRLQKQVNEICKNLDDDATWQDIEVQSIIDLENGTSIDDNKLSDLFAEEFKDLNSFDFIKKSNFDEKFENNFLLLFREHIKENHSACIAYESAMHNMIYKAVRNINDQLDSQHINRMIKEGIKEGISQYIKDIPTTQNEEIKEEIRQLKEYFNKKEIVKINSIDEDYVHFNGYDKTETNFSKIQDFFKGKCQFEYAGNTYYVDELTEEFFDYLAGNILVNKILAGRVMEILLKINLAPPIYTRSEVKFQEELEGILEAFRGVLPNLIFSLISAGNALNENQFCEKAQKDYVHLCYFIVERIINLSVFVILSQKYSNKAEALLCLDNHLYIDDKIKLLSRLLDELNNNDCNNNIIKQYLQNRDVDYKEDNLLILAHELIKLKGKPNRKQPVVEPFHCFRAESILTEFLVHFSFLANCKMISIMSIEYHNMLGNSNYPFIQRLISTQTNEGVSYKEVETSFSHAVFLTDKEDKHRVNLFPFLIDFNSMKVDTNISDFIFFNYCIPNNDDVSIRSFTKLIYLNEKGQDLKFLYDDHIQSFHDTQDSNEKILQYNINRLLDSLNNKPSLNE